MGILANISIHAPRTGSDRITSLTSDCHTISIHAPRTGSDCEARTTSISGCYFNPRSPHGERLRLLDFVIHVCKFQSTLPARGATLLLTGSIAQSDISIHAPRTGSDGYQLLINHQHLQFQSTLPARGATFARTDTRERPFISIHAPRTGSDAQSAKTASDKATISIHAPRTGSDVSILSSSCKSSYFNPRSPHGERRHFHWNHS